MKRYYEKYKHIIPLAIFGVIYVLWFYLLEHRTNVQYMVAASDGQGKAPAAVLHYAGIGKASDICYFRQR